MKMAKSKVNLHIHTTVSDGIKTVAEIIEALREAGVDTFSITDHESVKGNIEAAELAKKHGMKHINGIELSCRFCGKERLDTDPETACYVEGLDDTYICHLLGYGFDLDKMQAELDVLLENRFKSLRTLIEQLKNDGYVLEDERMLVNGVFSERTTIAKELVRLGAASDVSDAFNSILNTPRYKGYVTWLPAIYEGAQLIKKCGGIAILAHPIFATRGGKRQLSDLQVKQLWNKSKQWLDGMEVFYLLFSKEQIEFLESLIAEDSDKDYLMSIGTDYHHGSRGCVFHIKEVPADVERFWRREETNK